MNAKGPVFKYGDNIDTDVIIPARYLNTQSAAELASHCMEDIDKTFITSEAINEGDIVSVNFDTGVITDETTGQTFQAAPFPEFIQNIIKQGGLMNSLKD